VLTNKEIEKKGMERGNNMYKNFLKRIFDFIFAAIVLVIFSPFFILICIIIKLDSKGSIFFKQLRIGKNKKEFMILKFRSMTVDAPSEEPTCMLKNPDKYITNFGKFLRVTSLDELPQLINVIAGHMSIVGPRPVVCKEHDLIVKRNESGVYDVRPGLTGWAQINGRDEVLIDMKVKYDKEYVDRISLLFDLKCILKTFPLVLKAEGVSENGRIEEIEKKV